MENQQPAGEAKNGQKNWYATWWGIILIIMFLPFFAIWYVWAKTKWNAAIKGLVTLGVLIISVMAVGSGESENKNDIPQTSQQAEQKTEAQIAQTTENKQEEPKQEEPKPEEKIEPFEIAVSNQIVKKIDGKHRYFFDIRNNDTKDFNGKVAITLYNDKQNSALGGNTFEATAPIKPKLGNSVYIDINTGPVSAHGEYGITKFKYEVKIDNKIAKSGEGKITDKYEDISAYGL